MPSGGLSIRVTRDDLTPDLQRKLRAVEDPTPIWRAVGTGLVSYTKRSFRDASLRIAAWPAKRGGDASNLIRKGALLSSIRIVKLDKRGVTIGSDRLYAAIHQLGGVIRGKGGKPLVFQIGGKTIFAKSVKIPARPFFPFNADGSLAAKAEQPVKEIFQAAAGKAMGVT